MTYKPLNTYPATDCFHPDQVWETPRGYLYRVLECQVNGKAKLRAGTNGRGRIVYRAWDAVLGWRLRDELRAIELAPCSTEAEARTAMKESSK